MTYKTLLCTDSLPNSYVNNDETCLLERTRSGHEDSSLAIIWAESVFGQIWVLTQKQGHGDRDRTFPGHVQDWYN